MLLGYFRESFLKPYLRSQIFAMANYIGQITAISVHNIGNKAKDESLVLSENPVDLDDELKPILENYFNSAFKPVEAFEFYNENSLDYNLAYKTSEGIFENPNSLHEASKEFSRKLYEVQDHPNIKGGEFYTVYFKDCTLNGEVVDVVGLFKSENKDTFLKVRQRAGNLIVEPLTGINVKKLDKGCIVFNSEKENGFVVTVVDNTNKGSEARYWIDDFLQVRAKNDPYHQTENALSMCKSFINDALPAEFEVSKADQADLLNRSGQFFKQNQNFNLEAFSTEVMEQPEVIEKFNAFKGQFESAHDLQIDNDFDISAPAIKKNAKVFKSVIKLDKNFHIYVHGNSNLIERGKDDDGRKFYKVYFDEEH